MKQVWIVEVGCVPVGGAICQRLAFNTKRRAQAAYGKVVKAMREYEDRTNDRASLIEISADDGGKLACKPRDITTCRLVDMAEFGRIVDGEEGEKA